MSIYRAYPVSVEPEIYLERWSLRRTDSDAIHFVGFHVASGDGRVSTKVTELDVQRRTGRTESGRRYYLLGPGGYDSDAEYVWNWATRHWNISVWTNVTAELIPDWREPLPAIRDEASDVTTAPNESDDSPDAPRHHQPPDDD